MPKQILNLRKHLRDKFISAVCFSSATGCKFSGTIERLKHSCDNDPRCSWREESQACRSGRAGPGGCCPRWRRSWPPCSPSCCLGWCARRQACPELQSPWVCMRCPLRKSPAGRSPWEERTDILFTDRVKDWLNVQRLLNMIMLVSWLSLFQEFNFGQTGALYSIIRPLCEIFTRPSNRVTMLASNHYYMINAIQGNSEHTLGTLREHISECTHVPRLAISVYIVGTCIEYGKACTEGTLASSGGQTSLHNSKHQSNTPFLLG